VAVLVLMAAGLRGVLILLRPLTCRASSNLFTAARSGRVQVFWANGGLIGNEPAGVGILDSMLFDVWVSARPRAA
jgi:hypothetical protein